MSKLAQQILALLSDTEGLTDRQIATAILGESAPQQAVNSAARGLAAQGCLIRRRREDGLIGNYTNSGKVDPVRRQGRLNTPINAPPLAPLVARFVASVAAHRIEIYNEFSLQHEFGIFLRAELPQYLVRFERHVESFDFSKEAFTKREIDIVVCSKDKAEMIFAIELKYPRNGQYPEQMFSCCKDIAFAEELHTAGFSRTALLIFADDPCFWSGSTSGIYGHFRGGRPITGHIQKPTGNKDQDLRIKGSYTIAWTPVSSDIRCALVEVGA